MGLFSSKKTFSEDEVSNILQRGINDTLNILRLQGGEITPYLQNVSSNNVLGLSAAWSCVRLLSETFASLPFHVYQKTEKGNEEIDYDVKSLVGKMPHEYMSSFTWRSLAMSKILLHGNFVAYIERDNNYRPVRLTPILDEVKLKIADGELFYEFVFDGVKRMVAEYDIFHIKGYSDDGYWGKSVLSAHKDTLGIGLSAQRASKDFYDKGAKIDGYLQTDQSLRDDQFKRIKDTFSKKIENGERIPLLDGGLKLMPVKLSPADAQYIETRKFQELDIARIFRVPPHMIGIMDRATWSNVEALGIEFGKYTMLPYCINWEQEIDRKLFPENAQGKLFSKFSLEGLMRGDMKTRYESYAIAMQNGIKSINEIRQLEDMNPIDGGDKHYIQGNNMVDINNQINNEGNENPNG